MTNHEKHIAMWNEIAENPELEKWETVTHSKYPTRNSCYACEEAGFSDELDDGTDTVAISSHRMPICRNCPINWLSLSKPPKTGDAPCQWIGSLYNEWYELTALYGDIYESNYNERMKRVSRIAAKIRDIEWREVDEDDKSGG